MFREMRRKDKMKPVKETENILRACTNGVLSVIGDEGYPYGVPVSYVYDDGKIYLHCAGEGHKLDSIKKNAKVSFTVVGADCVDQKKVTTVYKSAICFGNARVVADDGEKEKVLTAILEKYCPDELTGGLEYMKKVFNDTVAVVIDIEHMTGKGLAD